MKQKHIVLTVALVGLLTLGASASVFALESDGETESNNTETSTKNREQPDSKSDAASRKAAREKEQNKRIQERKTELMEKYKARQADRKEKLQGKRLELCEKRQARINTLLEKSDERGKTKLAVFERIENGVKKFYETKELSSDRYDAAALNVEDKKALAVAAIDAMATQTFSCEKTDGAKPGGVIREAVQARHEAMKAYRTALKQLIEVVRQALKTAEAEGSTE